MDEIRFSYNWNNKLQCKAFTTIRIAGNKYTVDKEFKVVAPNGETFVGVVKGVKDFWLHNMNDYIAYIDTGYDSKECTNIIRKMYPQIDFTKKQLSLILIIKNENTTDIA